MAAEEIKRKICMSQMCSQSLLYVTLISMAFVGSLDAMIYSTFWNVKQESMRKQPLISMNNNI